MRNNKLVIIVPYYNEEEIIDYCVENLMALLKSLIGENLVSADSKICFVSDGSTDKSDEMVENYCKKESNIALIKLTRNYGQQAAMLAGFNVADADIAITVDADLQDDISVIKEMVQKYHEGCEIVYGCRKKRETDSFAKKTTAIMFYKFMNKIGIKIREDHSEFRLLSRFAIEKLKEYKEKTIFLRGIIQNIGLKSCDVFYDRHERTAGTTKYSFFKLLGLAWTAITSFSLLPLRIITVTGALTALLSFFIIIYGLVSYFKHYSIPGWTSIIMTMAFFSGIIIMSIGIIGEYLGKVLSEVKSRPTFQVEKTINL